MDGVIENSEYKGSIDLDTSLQVLPKALGLSGTPLKIFGVFQVWEIRPPQVGDHIRVRRKGVYTHHGVCVGDGEVVHFSGSGSDISPHGREIKKDTIEVFAAGGTVEVLEIAQDDRLPVAETVARAISRIGERDYNVRKNNCEHFANWCVQDKNHSRQVELVKKILIGLAASIGSITTAVVIKKMIDDKKPLDQIVAQVVKLEKPDVE